VRKREIDKLIKLKERLIAAGEPRSLSTAWAMGAIDSKLKRLNLYQTPGGESLNVI